MNPIPRLSADDRRAQIIEAITPAVLEHGAAITTRELAEAAGVAEGTLFKAFGDKESLLVALAEHHLDASSFAAEQGALEFDSIADLVETTSRTLVDRFRFVYRLVMALGPIGQRVASERHAEFESSKHRLAERFVPFRDELRVSPLVAADVLRSLAWAASSSWGEHSPTSEVDDIIQVLLHGIVRTEAATTRSADLVPAAGTPASAPENQKA